MPRLKISILLLAVVFGPLFWFGMRWNAYHSDGFRFAERIIESAPAVQSRIGKVIKVSFPILSRYKAFYGETYSRVHMEVNAQGERGQASLVLDLTEAEGAWKIDRSLIDGYPVNL